MKRLTLVLALLLVSALAGPSPTLAHHDTAKTKGFPVTLVDDLGNRVHLAHPPGRLLSLDPRDTETLFALGLEERVVGDGTKNFEGWTDLGGKFVDRDFRYPSEWPSPWGRDYPVRARELPHVEGGCCGTPWNLETIESLHPDLIFSLNSDLPTIQRMRDLGLTVIVLDPANLRGILHDIQLVGKATGATKQAGVVTRNIRKEVDAVRNAVAHVRSHPRAYYELDATNPTQPYLAGEGTYIDEAIRLAGGTNIARGITAPGCPGKDCYPAVSLEALVKLDPQIIILGDAKYGTTVASVKSRGGWSTISAVQSGKIYPFNDDWISRAGPTIGVGIRKLETLIHPEL